MKRIFSFVILALFAVVFTTAQAQNYVFIWTNGGHLSSKLLPNVDSLTFEEKPADIIINGHTFVDLGLPSGLLWAECNVGASSPIENGDYFAWGETMTKETYSWDTYKWERINHNAEMAKYNRTDGKKILDPEDDAATVNWGTGCRMPSYTDLMELVNECEFIQQSNYQGVYGYLVKGPNGNTIFLPHAGSKPSNVGCDISYWSSSTASSLPQTTMAFGVGVRTFYTGNAYRYIGLPVRPVAEK